MTIRCNQVSCQNQAYLVFQIIDLVRSGIPKNIKQIEEALLSDPEKLFSSVRCFCKNKVITKSRTLLECYFFKWKVILVIILYVAGETSPSQNHMDWVWGRGYSYFFLQAPQADCCLCNYFL